MEPVALSARIMGKIEEDGSSSRLSVLKARDDRFSAINRKRLMALKGQLQSLADLFWIIFTRPVLIQRDDFFPGPGLFYWMQWVWLNRIPPLGFDPY